MKKTVVMCIIGVLLLALGVMTGYLLKLREEVKGYEDRYGATKHRGDLYRSPLPLRAAAAPVSRAMPGRGIVSGFQNEPDSWDPFREMEAMQNMMDRLFRDSMTRGLTQGGSGDPRAMAYNPDIDFKETDKEYIARIDLPGIDKDKINLKIQNNQLIISGERQTEKEENRTGGGFYRAERSFGSFLRSMPLPADADTEKMTAECANGVLTVRIQKLTNASAAARKIDIK